MNLIEAYKKAKVGEKLIRSSDDNSYNDSSIEYREDFYLLVNEYTLSNEDWLADDWQIERKPLVWEGEVVWNGAIPTIAMCNLTEYLTEFYGKRTNIRIEEIMEELSAYHQERSDRRSY